MVCACLTVPYRRVIAVVADVLTRSNAAIVLIANGIFEILGLQRWNLLRANLSEMWHRYWRSRAEEENVELCRQVVHLTLDVNVERGQVRVLEQEVKRLRDELAPFQLELPDLREQVAALKEREAQLRDRLLAVTGDRDELKDDLETALKSVSELKLRLDATTRDLKLSEQFEEIQRLYRAVEGNPNQVELRNQFGGLIALYASQTRTYCALLEEERDRVGDRAFRGVSRVLLAQVEYLEMIFRTIALLLEIGRRS